MTGKEDKLGFPPGVAVRLLLKEFKKYEEFAKRDEEGRAKNKIMAPPTVNEIEVETSKPSSEPMEQAPVENPAPPASELMPSNTTSQATSNSTSTSQPTDGTTAELSAPKTEKKDEEEDMELTRQQQIFQANPESYNGAVRENYAWSQSITDVDVHAFIPKYIKKGRQVEVSIGKQHLFVCYHDDKGVKQVLVDDDLTWEVNKEESMWSLVPGEHVHINLEKREERWWEALSTNEPKINVRKIDCSRPMTDLDDEAQAKIEEMMYNDHRKKLGLPQSHEQKTHEMLRKAWDAQGSPFKGQPFDPSVLSVNPGGVVTMNNKT